jgi:hypothetical protein
VGSMQPGQPRDELGGRLAGDGVDLRRSGAERACWGASCKIHLLLPAPQAVPVPCDITYNRKLCPGHQGLASVEEQGERVSCLSGPLPRGQSSCMGDSNLPPDGKFACWQRWGCP